MSRFGSPAPAPAATAPAAGPAPAPDLGRGGHDHGGGGGGGDDDDDDDDGGGGSDDGLESAASSVLVVNGRPSNLPSPPYTISTTSSVYGGTDEDPLLGDESAPQRRCRTACEPRRRGRPL